MTQDCDSYRRLFVPYITGELDRDSRRELAAHLAACPECATEFGREWRARVEGGAPTPGERAGRPSRWGVLALLKGRRGMFLLLVLPLLWIVAFGHRFRGGPEPAKVAGTAAADVLTEMRGLLQGEARLREALVSVARQRIRPVGNQVRFEAVQVLHQARLALWQKDKEGVERCFDPFFVLVEGCPAGVDRIFERGDLLREPFWRENLLEKEEQFYWWDATPDSVTLYTWGRQKEGAMFVLHRSPREEWVIYWAQAVRARGKDRDTVAAPPREGRKD